MQSVKIKTLAKASRHLIKCLRHTPEDLNLNLDDNGWITVKDLLKACKNIYNLTFDELKEIVDTNDKKRFEFNESQTKIRACQGHTINIDLKLKAIMPPEYLYHGTNNEALNLIKQTGIKKMNRQHVHLSSNIDTATSVGSRKGKPIILSINAMVMYQDGYKFYKSNNDVWLIDFVPVKYIFNITIN